MSKRVKLRVLKAEGVTRDTTVGKVYEGWLSLKGQDCPLFGYECHEDSVSFYDDVGDKCCSHLNECLVELITGNGENVEENCPPTSESQFTDNSISSDQLQKLIAEAQVSVLIEEDAIKIWADNDVEIVAKDEADLLAKLKVFRAYSEMVNGG